MVKSEENGIRDHAEHPENDETDYQYKPLQPHLPKTDMHKMSVSRNWWNWLPVQTTAATPTKTDMHKISIKKV